MVKMKVQRDVAMYGRGFTVGRTVALGDRRMSGGQGVGRGEIAT